MKVEPAELRELADTVHGYAADVAGVAYPSPFPDSAGTAMPDSVIATAASGLGDSIALAIDTISGHLQRTANILNMAATGYGDSDAAAANALRRSGAISEVD